MARPTLKPHRQRDQRANGTLDCSFSGSNGSCWRRLTEPKLCSRSLGRMLLALQASWQSGDSTVDSNARTGMRHIC